MVLTTDVNTLLYKYVLCIVKSYSSRPTVILIDFSLVLLSCGHWTLDTQYGFLGSEIVTGYLDLDNGSKKELHNQVAVLQTGCINNQTIKMMITMRNPTLSLTLRPCLSPFQMQN